MNKKIERGSVMKKILLVLMMLSTLLFSSTVTIAVAANVSYAIDPLIKAFNKTNPEIKINVVLGSSGKLTAQISHGAPYDIFISANMKYPQKLYDEKMAITKPTVYAQGALALLSQKKQDFSKNIEILNQSTIDKIAIGNPKTAPYGVAAVEALKNAKLYEKLKEKFVYGESISQTVIYATSAADVGMIAMSALYSPKMKTYEKSTQWVEVDEKLYTPINQGIVLLTHAKENAEAKAFYDFMLSSKAKVILQSYGYKTP